MYCFAPCALFLCIADSRKSPQSRRQAFEQRLLMLLSPYGKAQVSAIRACSSLCLPHAAHGSSKVQEGGSMWSACTCSLSFRACSSGSCRMPSF